MDTMKLDTSKHLDYSDGYAPGYNDNYVLGINIGVGVSEVHIGHEGSYVLDEINAFDKAEVDEALLGQINMVTVSSFCGPNGLILGHDLFKEERVKLESGYADYIDVYSVWPLIEATKALLGTVDKPRARFMPGAHVFCATKNYKKHGAGMVYAGIALAIPADRTKTACLMMEDSGEIPAGVDFKEYERRINDSLVASVLNVAANQKVKFNEVYVGIKAKTTGEGQVGCALVASPYIVMPKKLVDFVEKKGIANTTKEDLDGIYQL